MPTPRSKPDIQYRTAELRASDDGAGFSGYASHFWSVDSYFEAVKPGAFKKTVRERGDRVLVLDQHDSAFPIGRLTDLKEDKTGLYFNAAISEGTTHGKDVLALLRDEVPLGMSFGFQRIKSRAAEKDDPITFDEYKPKLEEITILEEAKLWEVSVVSFPANQLATINDIRSVAEADALTSLIEHIRDGSLSDEHATLVAELVAAFEQRAEAGPPEGTTPLPAEIARRRNRDIEISLALASANGWIGVTHA